MAEANELILVVNSGSSSIKLALYDITNDEELVSALGEALAGPTARLTAKGAFRASMDLPNGDHGAVLSAFMDMLRDNNFDLANIAVIGHRVVHGGEHFSDSALIDDDVLAQIEACEPLAPLHNPANLTGIRQLAALLPDRPQVAVFDTAFHQTLPEKAFRYAIPARLYSESALRRYGFHGTSHRFVAGKAAAWLERDLAETNLISAHLGNGCSVCAVAGGLSVDTSMGLTPLEGVPMGTRSGSIDPGLMLHLLQRMSMNPAELDQMLNRQSGLLGLSGLSNDMRTLTGAAEEGYTEAKLAIDVFCYQVAKTIASYWAVSKGPHAIILTGGIGEHAKGVRAQIIGELSAFGLTLDGAANDQAIPGDTGVLCIGQSDNTRVLAISTNEELMIAQDARRLLDAAKGV
ncbi:acetate kinase [Allohahella marinimesophila]|uniref:Acetate kinase n=1 Tax=Allohahella marinimesophila TaxID=1054972 RepID=A0ABP7P4G9_9GAMM